MTANQRLSLICRVLLLPFRDVRFGKEDLLLAKAQMYRKFIDQEGTEHQLYGAYRNCRKKLMDQVCSEGKPENMDEVQQLLEFFYGDTDMLGCAESNNADSLYIQRILDISDSFVTLRDGRMSLRTWINPDRLDLFHPYAGLHKAELWNMLVRLSTPDLWIAAYFEHAGLQDVVSLSNLTDDLRLADIVLNRCLEKGMAETHTHFYASLNYQMLWTLVSDVTQLRYEAKARQSNLKPLSLVLTGGLLRLFLASYAMQGSEHEDFLPYCERLLNLEKVDDPQMLICQVLYSGYSGERLEESAEAYLEQYEHCTQALHEMMDIQEDKWEFDLLARSVYRGYRYLNTSCDILLFRQTLALARKKDKPTLRRALLQYIRIKNTFFSTRTQAEDVHGLRQFSGYYRRSTGSVWALRRGNEEGLNREGSYAIFRSQSRLPYLQKYEFKITPPGPQGHILDQLTVRKKLMRSAISRQLLQIVDGYLQFLKRTAQSYTRDEESVDQTLKRLGDSGEVSIPTPGIIYHFTKPEFMRNIFGLVCGMDPIVRKDTSPYYVETLRRQYMVFCDTLSEMVRETPYLGEYVVGLDAASEEMGIEPWVYAPVFTYARRKGNTVPIQWYTKSTIPSLGLTYHVGEDFRHLLSGLRVVDEVLEHFGFKAGDRIGHGIALQVDPQEWQDQHGVVAVPRMEYLENLLWIWGVRFQGGILPIPHDLELKIMRQAESLYPTVSGITPYLLWKVYQKKFHLLDVEGVVEDVQECQNCLRCGGIDGACPLQNRCHNMIWSEERLLLTHFCPLYQEKYRKPIFVQATVDEIPLMKALQKGIKEKIGQRGITVEVNPTSNASIGAIRGVLHHPILHLNNRWLERDGEANHLSVSINSDDPVVFHTMVENEFSYIYYMLTNEGYSRQDVLQWMNQIREFGMESSFVRKEKKPQVLLRELKLIRECLQSYPDFHAEEG